MKIFKKLLRQIFLCEAVISLCNNTYKAITKIISWRLRPFMSKLIRPCQTSFLESRQTSNNVIIVLEIINHYRKMKGKESNMILKLDLEKAFDKIEWSFIIGTLRLFNLPHNLIKLIMSCITSRGLQSSLMGGKQVISNQLKDYDKETPYLPICSSCAYRFSQRKLTMRSPKKLDSNENLQKRSKNLHLFFADNLILISQSSISNCYCIIGIVKFFSETSDQTINTNKSKLIF